jgi:hypothetical protein
VRQSTGKHLCIFAPECCLIFIEQSFFSFCCISKSVFVCSFFSSFHSSFFIYNFRSKRGRKRTQGRKEDGYSRMLFSRTMRLGLGRVAQRGGDSHGTPIKEAGGVLFGERPGDRKGRESWELIYYIGMGASLVLATVGLWSKPDTSIKTYARQEALARGQSSDS